MAKPRFPIYGYLAEFSTGEELLAACERSRRARAGCG